MKRGDFFKSLAYKDSAGGDKIVTANNQNKDTNMKGA